MRGSLNNTGGVPGGWAVGSGCNEGGCLNNDSGETKNDLLD
jgi:hypothetical protein